MALDRVMLETFHARDGTKGSREPDLMIRQITYDITFGKLDENELSFLVCLDTTIYTALRYEDMVGGLMFCHG